MAEFKKIALFFSFISIGKLFALQYSLKASSLNTLIQLVKGEMGTTLVPKMALNELVGNKKGLSISHLNEPGPHREIALITRPHYAGIDSIRMLVNFFEKSLKALDEI